MVDVCYNCDKVVQIYFRLYTGHKEKNRNHEQLRPLNLSGLSGTHNESFIAADSKPSKDIFTKNSDLMGITAGAQIIWPDNSKNLVYSASNTNIAHPPHSKTPEQTSTKYRGGLSSSQRPMRISGKRNIVELSQL